MKAIALISGGLDSILAARVIKEQGIEVRGVYFKIPFAVANKKRGAKNHPSLERLMQSAGMSFKEIELKEEFLDIVRKPAHGYGSNVNPCIDCKILMLRKAKELMQESGASFIVTGEVLAQRPMSQNRQSLDNIERDAEVKGILLRPLSAKLMQETEVEKNGWVKRDRLLSFNGRSRRPQFDLAEKYGIEGFTDPAGGCLLTVPDFSRRVKDLIKYKALTIDNVELLKVGRHFRLSELTKLIIARDESECKKLIELAHPGDYLFYPDAVTAGATALLQGKINEELIQLSVRLATSYFDLNGAASASIVYRIMPSPEEKTIIASPISKEELAKLRV